MPEGIRKSFTIDPQSGSFVPRNIRPDISGHVVFLNVNEKLPKIIREIQLGTGDDALEIVVVVPRWDQWIEMKQWHPQPPYPKDIYFMQGYVAEKPDLERARVAFAKVAVVLADPAQGELADAHTTLTAVAIENINPQVHTVVELISSVNRVHLQYTKVNEVVCIGELTEKLIAQTCISPGIKKVFDHLLSAEQSTMQIFTVPLPDTLIGKTYRELTAAAIRKDAPLIICGFARMPKKPDPHQGANPITILNPRYGQEPGKDTILEPGDRIIVMAYQRPTLQKLADS